VHLADTLIDVNSADPGFDRYGPKTATAARRPSPKGAPRKSSASRCWSDHDPTGTYSDMEVISFTLPGTMAYWPVALVISIGWGED